MAKVAEAPKVKKEVVVTMDTPEAEVLQLNLDTDVLLKFDSANFKRLPESIVRELRYENGKAYHIALGAVLNPRPDATKQKIDFSSPLDIGNERALEIRRRPGWHQCWIMGTQVNGNDGEVDLYKEVGYKPVRKAKENEKPGEESGEIVKRRDFGKAEMVAMEVPEELYQKHIHAKAMESVGKYKANKEQFLQNIEQENAKLRREARVRVVDDEGDV